MSSTMTRSTGQGASSAPPWSSLQPPVRVVSCRTTPRQEPNTLAPREVAPWSNTTVALEVCCRRLTSGRILPSLASPRSTQTLSAAEPSRSSTKTTSTGFLLCFLCEFDDSSSIPW